MAFGEINKPNKLVIRFRQSGKITLNEPFKDVVSVKLLSAYGSSQKSTAWGGIFFAIFYGSGSSIKTIT